MMYTEQRHGIPEFVLVDGIGDKLLIPFRSMSKTINSRNVRKVEAKIKSKIKYYNIGQ
nr:YrbL family protein [Psychrobacter sp. JCM 18900]